MKKLLLIALALNLVACSTDDSAESSTPSNANATVKEANFNPNPTRQDYLIAKHPAFMASKDSLKSSPGSSGSSTAKTTAFVSTYVPDANFRTALLNIGAAQDANPGDQYIEVDNTRVGLGISGAGISDLTGINGFTALKVLVVSQNNLTTINVSGLANLERIECQQNQLTTLNLSANTNLQEVWCHLNQLTSLVLPNSPALFGVWCYSNQLTTLNLNNNTGITQLFIQGNQLTSFNFAPFVNIEQMNVSSNKWITLNFNSNNKIRSIWAFNITTLTDLSIKNGANTLVNIQDFTGNTKRPPIHVDASFLSNANTAWPNRGASTYVL